MPTVPTTFVPQVAPQGGGDIGQFAAPGVAPMENLAPRQQIELGRTMTQAGNVAFRVGSSLQDALDEAAAKEADVAVLTQFGELSSAYLSTQGKESETQFQAASERLSQIGATAMDGLQTETQKRMFAPVLARNMASIQTRMAGHRNEQVKKYNVQEGIARGEMYADQAVVAYANKDAINPMTGQPFGRDEYDVNIGVALNSIRSAAAEMGIPADSAQVKQMEQRVYDKVATGVVGDLMRQNKYAEAQAFLDEMSGIDPKTNDTLRNSVEANRTRTTIEELTNSIRSQGVLNAKSDPETYGQVAGETTTQPDTLRQALDVADGIEDVEMRRMVQANLRTQFAQDDALATQEYRTQLENIEQFLSVPTNGIGDVDPIAWGALKPTDRERLLKGEKTRNDERVMDILYTDPSKLTPEFMSENYNKLTPETRRKLFDMLAKPQAILDATVDAQQVNRTLIDNGLSDLASAEKSDKKNWEASVILRQNIQETIAAKQSSLGRMMSDAEKQPIIDQAILALGNVKNKWMGIDWLGKDLKRLPVAAMSAEQQKNAYIEIEGKEIPLLQAQAEHMEIPDAEIPKIRKALLDEGMTRYTWIDVLKMWYEKKGKK
jgi:hypothetical protein